MGEGRGAGAEGTTFTDSRRLVGTYCFGLYLVFVRFGFYLFFMLPLSTSVICRSIGQLIALCKTNQLRFPVVRISSNIFRFE